MTSPTHPHTWGPPDPDRLDDLRVALLEEVEPPVAVYLLGLMRAHSERAERLSLALGVGIGIVIGSGLTSHILMTWGTP